MPTGHTKRKSPASRVATDLGGVRPDVGEGVERAEIAGDPQILADAIPGAKCISLPACDHFSAIPHALFKAAVFDFFEGWLDEGPEPY